MAPPSGEDVSTHVPKSATNPDDTPQPEEHKETLMAGPSGSKDDRTESPVVGLSGSQDDHTESPVAGPSGSKDDRTESPVVGLSGSQDDHTESPVAGPSGSKDDRTESPVVGLSGSHDDHTESPVAGPSGSKDENVNNPGGATVPTKLTTVELKSHSVGGNGKAADDTNDIPPTTASESAAEKSTVQKSVPQKAVSEASILSRGSIVVVKVGTSSVMRDKTQSDGSLSSEAAAGLEPGAGELALSTLALLVDMMLGLKRAGHHVLLVTSGAVGVGCRELGIANRPKVDEHMSPQEKAAVMAKIQAYAAVGQAVLMRTYSDLLRMAGQPTAQVLLTSQDLGKEYQYANAKNTLRALLEMNVIPIVNENDTVATDEVKFGDNDWMSALVSTAVNADWLFLMTDVERLYTANPRTDKNAKPIDLVEDIATLDRMGVGSGSEKSAGTQWGTGGIATKINAARLATAAGVRVALVHGRYPERVLDYVLDREGKLGTVFAPRARPLTNQRKQWILQCVPPRGDLILTEQGAAKLLEGDEAATLTTLSIASVSGFWIRNSVVRLRDQEGHEIGRGISSYGSGELNEFKGLDAQSITARIGTPASTLVIHEHDLATYLHEPQSCTEDNKNSVDE